MTTAATPGSAAAIERVVVGIDGSPAGDRALAWE